MKLKDQYDFENLKNITEEFVFNEVARQLDAISDEDICKCQECVGDIVCYILNKVPARYVVSLTGSIFTKAEEAETRISEIVPLATEAIEKIALNPAHSHY